MDPDQGAKGSGSCAPISAEPWRLEVFEARIRIGLADASSFAKSSQLGLEVLGR